VLAENRYEDFLDPVLWRLTVLRNQIAHGCVTYGSRSKGFPGVLDGLGVLRSVVPAFERLTTTWGLKLNDDPELQWEPLPYPRLESVRHPALGRLS